MPNTTNEVVINGEVVLSTRGNTVTEDTLVQGKTAQDKTGKEIEGNLDPVSHEELNELKEQVDALDEEAYKLSDEEGEISESDYIPFNDASDGNEPKKKTLFSSIIDKLKDIFAQKSDLKKHTFEVGTALPTSTIIDNYHTDDFVGTYYIESDAVASEITTLPEAICGKLIVTNNGNGGFSQYYIPNHSVKIWVRVWWSNAWSTWQDISSGGGDSKPHTYDKGTAIPVNSDLNDYKTEGVYFVADTGTAETIDNIPVTGAGKLIVMDRDTGARIFQIYIASKDNIYIRDMNNDSIFSAWKNISRSHTFELGEMIPSSSDLNLYKTEGVYYVQLDSTASTISNVPAIKAGKLVVAKITSANNYLIQTYCANASTDIYVRWYNPNGDSWHDWKNLSRSHSFEDGTDIPADSDLNDYKTAGVYTTTNDATASTIANIPVASTGKLIVSYSAPSHNYIQQIYIVASTNEIYTRYYDNWNSTWREWKQLATTAQLKPHSFELGTAIPANSDLNNYTTVGAYNIELDATAKTIANIPVGNAGKLVVSVLRNTTNRRQMYYKYNSFAVYSRIYNNGWSNWECLYSGVQSDDIVLNHQNGSLWSQIKHRINGDKRLYVNFSLDGGSTWDGDKQIALTSDISPSTVGNGYAVATVSGATITATISGFQLRAGVIVALKFTTDVTTDCTLNISNTGAKSVKYWDDEAVSVGRRIGYAVFTFIYDGTYYRVLGHERTPITAVQNYVADTSGNELIEWGYGSNRAQIKHNLSNNKLQFNYYKNSAWRGDVNIADNYDLTLIHDTLGAKNLFSWDLYTDIFIDNNPSGTSYASHTISNGIITVTFTTSSGESHKGIYVSQVRINQMLSDFNGLSITLSCDVKVNTAVTNFRFGTDTSSGYFSVGTDYTHIEHKMTLDTSKTTNNLIFYIPTTSAHTFYVKNIMVRPALISSQKYVPYSLTNQQIINGLGASVAKTGKSILPLWDYTTNTWSTNGLIFTFNPTTGQITVNGTATADVDCRLLEPTKYQFRIPKGEYILSGCPSGGSDTKYSIRLAVYDGTNVLGFNDYGSGCEVTLSKDCYSSVSANTGFFLIRVKSGQTLSNLVFKPMLRPAYTTAEHEPCEDIHKGNCYVGTCTTAGGTKDKVAYVDGYFVLRKGVRVAIKFINTNTYFNVTSSPITLNVNGTGAKNIWYWSTHSGAGNTGTNTVPYGYAGRYATYYYDGTYWVWDGMSGESNDNQRKSFYGTCSTAGDQQVKVVTLADTSGWELRAGTIVGVKFTNTNTYSATADNHIQLNVNNTGAKNIYYNTGYPTGTSNIVFGTANRVHYYMYNGTDWCWMNHGVDLDTVDPRVLGFGYGTCTTAEATTAKVVTLASYALRTGGYVSVKFSYNVPANSTMNINSRGAKEIWYRGAKIANNIIRANDLATFIYDGTNYQLVGVDRDSTAQKYYITRDEVTWSAVLGSNYNTTTWACNIHRSGNILIGSMEIATSQGSNSITFPSYSSNTTNVFCRFTYKPLSGYFECIVTIDATTYPAFITSSSINGTNYTMIVLRNPITITSNKNIKVSFFAFLENT